MTTPNPAPASGIPYSDWQFWVATFLAVVAAYVVARMVLPASWLPGSAQRRERKVSITIEGKKPAK